MSQLGRQRHYAQAHQHCEELAELIKASNASDKQKSRMIDLLSALWLQAELACGGEECRP